MWFRSVFQAPTRPSDPARRRAARPRLQVEPLDERAIPSLVGTLSYAVGQYPQAVVTGEFNGDGKLDLAVANEYDNTVSVLLGKGDGKLQPAVNAVTGYYPLSLAVGDFNGDGKLDLATANDGGVGV